jgi:hypothetical protein
MRELLTTPFFGPVSSLMERHVKRILEADLLHISAPATLEGVLALGQLEAACLDLKLRYSRRFTTPRRHVPRDESAVPQCPEHGLGLFCDVEGETWQPDELEQTPLLHLLPLQTHLAMGGQGRRHVGALDPVIQAAAIGAQLAPNGRRVRALRPFLSLGLWFRAGLDTSYDPIHSNVIAHLQEEGSVRTLPLPEIIEPVTDMMPGLSERQLKRLTKVWPNMDVDQRTLALSELVLPCLAHGQLSTPRLEELVWHRMVARDHEQDVVSQAHLAQRRWPEDAEEARKHASKLLDSWLATGRLNAPVQATD